MSALGATASGPLPRSARAERAGNQRAISRSQFSFSDAGHTTSAGYAPSASIAASASTVLPSPCSSARNARALGEHVAHARTLERLQLAAEAW